MMDSKSLDFKSIEKLLILAKKHKLAELEVESGKLKVRIKTALGARSASGLVSQSAAYVPAPMMHDVPPLSESPKNLGPKDDDRYIKVLSPFVGTFYRSPSPDGDPYVTEGQVVKKGETLCIIEAMKLMNEIESDAPGRIVSVLAENGQPVEYGEPLFLIDPV
jgi:acetyl-CoA carboxylase biotin carboxyl carrier protein